MARTIQEIAAEMEAAVQVEPALQGLNSPSRLAIWRLLIYVFAAGLWALENAFEEMAKAVDTALQNMRPHTARWYQQKSLLYQHGHMLSPERDYYDNTELSADQVAAQKVVAYSAVTEVARGLLIKVAGNHAGELVPLAAAELTGLVAYMNRVKDAGVRLYIKSSPSDALRLSLKVFYDPLVLLASGARLDGTDPQPVKNRIRKFLKEEIPFNGLFASSRLIDALQQVEGVVIPHLVSAEARYGLLTWQPVAVTYQPDAGWIRIADADLNIEYIPHEPL